MAVAAVSSLIASFDAGAQQNVPLQEAQRAAANWENHGGSADESGLSRLSDINTATISRAIDLDGEVTLEAPPLEVNGVIYFTGSYSSVCAVDALRRVLMTHECAIPVVATTYTLRPPLLTGCSLAI